MARGSFTMRLYYERPLYEAARLIGYAGCEPSAFWEQAKQLDISQEKLLNAVYHLTRADRREAPMPRYELRADVRQKCFQLLGPAPEHPMHDFLRYGPPDIMGEENIRRWQDEFRKRKAAEVDRATEDQAGPEKKRGKKGRNR
jgi:hypothetical protein